jgi:hypothetical protein
MVIIFGRDLVLRGWDLGLKAREAGPAALECGLEAQAIREPVCVHLGVIALPEMPRHAFAEKRDPAGQIEEVPEG